MFPQEGTFTHQLTIEILDRTGGPGHVDVDTMDSIIKSVREKFPVSPQIQNGCECFVIHGNDDKYGPVVYAVEFLRNDADIIRAKLYKEKHNLLHLLHPEHFPKIFEVGVFPYDAKDGEGRKYVNYSIRQFVEVEPHGQASYEEMRQIVDEIRWESIGLGINFELDSYNPGNYLFGRTNGSREASAYYVDKIKGYSVRWVIDWDTLQKYLIYKRGQANEVLAELELLRQNIEECQDIFEECSY
ncbi:hypothetical protein JW978_04295 [Candidatus Dojkabacteria bacterium]|nr:hypothetical protein [Candidatus Dojkabacteria bacterium]